MAQDTESTPKPMTTLERLRSNATLTTLAKELLALASDVPGYVLKRAQFASKIVAELARRGASKDAIDGEVEVSDEPELSDDPNSPNYRYRDTGYIADSRKERAQDMIRIARETGTSVKATDIDWDAIEKNPRVAAEVITKSNLFGQTDWERLKGDGMEPGAGFLIDRIYASIAPQPADDTQARRDYALALQTIRKRLESCKTADQVGEVLGEIRDELTGSQLNAEEAEQYASLDEQAETLRNRYRVLDKELTVLTRAASALNSQVSNLEWDQTKRERRGWKRDPEIDKQIAALKPKAAAAWQAAVDWKAANPEYEDKTTEVKQADGWTAIVSTSGLRAEIQKLSKQSEGIKQAARFRNITTSPLTRGWIAFGERFMKLINFRAYKGSDTFAGHYTNAKTGKVKDWAWAEKDRVVVKRATKKEVSFQLKVADKYERKGGQQIKVDSTLKLKELMGFRDVQSGNWVLKDRNSAAFHVQQTAEAMSDMSDVLGIKMGDLGLGGRLGLAFGARGTGNAGFGGAAAAHYEHVHRVINLTKMGGGGALGHEFFHAIDNMIGELATGSAGAKNTFASITPDVLPAGALRDAMAAVAMSLRSGEHRTTEAIKLKEGDKAKAKHNIDSSYPGTIAKGIKLAAGLDAAVLYVDDYFGMRTDARSLKLKKQWRTLAAAYYAPDGVLAVQSKTGPLRSSFLKEAIILDGGVHGKYWSAPDELAARAFQAYLEDRLQGMDRRNDYLSVYADNKYHFDPILGIQFNPYPEGEERVQMNAAFDKFFEAVRSEQVFEKATKNTALLDAIFGPADAPELPVHAAQFEHDFAVWTADVFAETNEDAHDKVRGWLRSGEMARAIEMGALAQEPMVYGAMKGASLYVNADQRAISEVSPTGAIAQRPE